jgi:hypothetical protein
MHITFDCTPLSQPAKYSSYSDYKFIFQLCVDVATPGPSLGSALQRCCLRCWLLFVCRWAGALLSSPG